MSTAAWVILLILLVPALGLLVWLVLSASLVRVPTGALGLVLVRGRPSDTVLQPGLHLVPALRRHMLELYPSVELAYRPGVPGAWTDELNHTGPSLDVWLGDRTAVQMACTVRFRLRAERLRDVHERFGPAGFFGLVQDESARVLSRQFADPAATVDQLFEPDLERREQELADAIATAIEPLGFEVTFLALGPVDLGRAGELVQQISRKQRELALEEADAEVRLARARHDAELQGVAQLDEASWRYREADIWRELAHRSGGLQLALRVADPPPAALRTAAPAATDPEGPAS